MLEMIILYMYHHPNIPLNPTVHFRRTWTVIICLQDFINKYGMYQLLFRYRRYDLVSPS